MADYKVILFFLVAIGFPLPIINIILLIFYPPQCSLIAIYVIVYVSTNTLFYILSIIFVCCFKDYLYHQLQNSKIKIAVYIVSIFNILLSIAGVLSLALFCSQTSVGGTLVIVIATDIILLFIINVIQLFAVCSAAIME